MRKHAFCICENKGADQLHGDPGLCFCYIVSTINPLQASYFTVQFMSDLVGIPKGRFSCGTAHMCQT